MLLTPYPSPLHYMCLISAGPEPPQAITPAKQGPEYQAATVHLHILPYVCEKVLCEA